MMTPERESEIRARQTTGFYCSVFASFDVSDLLAAVDALRQAVVTLGRAAAFYADFEESSHSDWAIAVPACVEVYGKVPQVDGPGDDPRVYEFPTTVVSS